MRNLPLFLALLFLALPSLAQDFTITEEDYFRAEQAMTSPGTVYGTGVRPNWSADGTFWYRVDTRRGQEFIVVDPDRGTRSELFNHERLAAALSSASGETYEAYDLPFSYLIRSEDGRRIQLVVGPNGYDCSITGRRYACDVIDADPSVERPPSPWARYRSMEIPSPDGSKEAFIRDHNLWVRDLASGEETALTQDGVEDYGYATNNAGWTKSDRPVLLWSPNSEMIATFRHDARGVGMMHLVSTTSGHPELESWKYPLPGDSLIFRIERVVLHVDDARMVRLDMAPDMHRSTITDHIVDGGEWADIEWSPDSSRLIFVSSSRDHKQAILREANPETGAVRDILEEVEDTFYESGYNVVNNQFLPKSDQMLWYSQRDDWGHLYRYDMASGDLVNQITSGSWKVLAVQHIDEDAETIWFTGAGREPGDPYFQYLYAVNFDGSNLRLLTPDSLNHSVSFSPDFRYFVDAASSPTDPGRTVLRRSSDGGTVVDLERGDIDDLLASGWVAPKPFVVKARDGETDLYGLMYVPSNFEQGRKYPILNYLYPGPQTGSVGSRSFSAVRRDKQATAELGFIVVELDAMGTPLRSHSFHSAYYGDMGDNGLPDQVSGIKQLAERYPFMDIDRVGIWGHSGGGFASTAGILRYPDFYKVAVSGAGNHDNATYEDDWGEKWHGLLVRNEDGSTNYDRQANHLLVDNLKGKLLIAHGLMDDNVPPNNSLLLAEALMKANKDFDMIMIPNQRHGFGPLRQYWMRKRWDYFVQHLHGVTPPKEFEFGRERPEIVPPSG